MTNKFPASMLDGRHVQRFFNAICEHFPCALGASSILVTHILPDRPFLIDALSRMTHLDMILAKPRSVHRQTLKRLAQSYPVEVLQGRFTDGLATVEMIAKRCSGRPVAILDIGGYFSDVADFIATNYGAGFLGIVEDTENGLQRYQRTANVVSPVISVARSPLKQSEDYLVGQSIVYSVEALLRQQGDILNGRTACVIGYGKLGRSIANLLHAQHVRTVVYDIDPIRRVDAMSHGFASDCSLEQNLNGAGLVFCASGNMSLKGDDFLALDHGCYIATVTSSDDELDVDALHRLFRRQRVNRYITRYARDERHFYLMNQGQAVNFIHGAAVGSFIYLIQAELLASLSRLSTGDIAAGISENGEDLRREIAGIWLDHFGTGGHC